MNKIHTYVQTHMYILICIYSSIDIRWKRYVYAFIVCTDPYTHTYTYVGKVAIILKRRQWIWTGVKDEERKKFRMMFTHYSNMFSRKRNEIRNYLGAYDLCLCVYFSVCVHIYTWMFFIQRCAYVSIHRCIHRCLLMLMDDTYQHQLSF